MESQRVGHDLATKQQHNRGHPAHASFLASCSTCLPKSSKNEQIDVIVNLMILVSSMDIRTTYCRLQLVPLTEEKMKEYGK